MTVADIPSRTTRFRTLLLRALLGGAIGGSVVILIPFLFQFGGRLSDNLLPYLLILYVTYGLPCGAIVGAMAGTLVWFIEHGCRIELGSVGRLLVSLGAGFTFWTALYFVLDTLQLSQTSAWADQIGAVLVFGIITGGAACIALVVRTNDVTATLLSALKR